MVSNESVEWTRAGDIPEIYGRCVVLVPMDPNFHDISVGLYVKNGVVTVWTFSQKSGVERRIKKIRDQLVNLGGLESVQGVHNQARYRCGQLHQRPTRFLATQAVEKSPDHLLPAGKFPVKDLKSALSLGVDGAEIEGRWAYSVIAQGEAPNEAMRIRAVTAGFIRYGEMEKVAEGRVAFTCGYRHDNLVRIVLPYARNVSQVEDMLEAEDARGQMTTSSLGFTPPT